MNQESAHPFPTNAVLEKARRTLPYPAARAVHELQRAHTDKDRYEALLHAAEILAITVCATTAAVLQAWGQEFPEGTPRRQTPGDPYLSRLYDVYRRGATFGSWPHWLDQLSSLASSHPDRFPGLRDALADSPDDPGLVAHLVVLRDERNRPAHGDRPQSQEEASLRIAACAPHFEQILLKAQFLEFMLWLFIVSSGFNRKVASFDVVTHRLQGDHPDFDQVPFTWKRPVADDTLYLLAEDGPIPLAPFLASLYCRRCTKREICYTQWVRNAGPAKLKSFDRGHEIEVPELGEELRSLFQSLEGSRSPQPPTSR